MTDARCSRNFGWPRSSVSRRWSWRPSRIAPSRWVAVTSGPSIAWEGHRLAQNLLARKRSCVLDELRYDRITPAQCHQHDLGRDAETKRHDAAAQTAGDVDIALLARVPVREFFAVARRPHRRPPEQPHLAAVGVPRKLQRHPRRHAHRDVGLVRQKNDRRVVANFPKRRREIIDADTLDRPEPPCRKIGQLIAEPGKPERATGFGKPLYVVFVNRNADGFERAPRNRRPLPLALHGLVIPPVVIAEDRMDAKRGLQAGKHGRPFAGRNVARSVATP